MKCPTCNGKMIKRTSTILQDGVEFEAHKCVSCNEEILDMQQMKALAGKYRQLRKAKEVKFMKWGNSIAVRIPKDIADELKISDGSLGLLIKDAKGIRIIPG